MTLVDIQVEYNIRFIHKEENTKTFPGDDSYHEQESPQLITGITSIGKQKMPCRWYV